MRTMDFIGRDTLYLGGKSVSPATTATITVRSASTEEAIGEVPAAAEADVDVAVAAARAAFSDSSGWSAWDPVRRADALLKMAAVVSEHGERFATLVSAQNGMPISTARQIEGGFPGALLQYYAGLVRQQPVEERRQGLLGGDVIVRREPLGVVAAVVPWNFPQALLFTKLAPALAAGCTVVVKPSPETVLDTFLLADLLEANEILPPGVINFVPGGRDVGAHLVSHPDVDKVAFTGSTTVGKAIGEICGRLLRPVTLELGGKSAAIVLDDADLSSSAAELFAATLMNNGQTCFLSTRVLAPRTRYDEVVDALTDMAASAVVGDALAEDTMIGPMVSDAHRDRVEGFIARGRAEGARITTGGGRGTHDRGWFVEPTIFADADNTMAIAREEIFGPVLTVIPYNDIDDAINIANDSAYGLAGTVWTKDRERGIEIARRAHTGTFGVNAYVTDPVGPFGGVKASGVGRELGPEGLASYQQAKSIYTTGA
jgi:aldehyde dehydrogenase (NAD+)